MSYENSFEDYFVDNDAELLDTWLDRTDWKLFDSWLADQEELIKIAKAKFLLDYKAKEYQAFTQWAEECFNDRPEPDYEDR